MATCVAWPWATGVVNDANGQASAVIRPDHRYGPIGEHRRRDRQCEDQHGKHYPRDHRSTRSRYRHSSRDRPAASAIEPSGHAGAGAHDRPEVMLGRRAPGERARRRAEGPGAGGRRLCGRERRGGPAPTGQRCPSENSSPGDR